MHISVSSKPKPTMHVKMHTDSKRWKSRFVHQNYCHIIDLCLTIECVYEKELVANLIVIANCLRYTLTTTTTHNNSFTAISTNKICVKNAERRYYFRWRKAMNLLLTCIDIKKWTCASIYTIVINTTSYIYSESYVIPYSENIAPLF